MCLCVCACARTCAFALGRWLQHDCPSNETMYSVGPRGFRLSIRTRHCNELWLFYVEKKKKELIISPTVTEG